MLEKKTVNKARNAFQVIKIMLTLRAYINEWKSNYAIEKVIINFKTHCNS